MCEGLRAAVSEEVTLALSSEEQTGESAGGRARRKLTYGAVPVTAGPFLDEEEMGSPGQRSRAGRRPGFLLESSRELAMGLNRPVPPDQMVHFQGIVQVREWRWVSL